MSLNRAQRAATAKELARNAQLSGLPHDDLVARSGLTSPRFDAALAVDGGDPADVWLVRDLVADAAREAGQEPVPYSVLTEQMRSAAGVWFGVPGRD